MSHFPRRRLCFAAATLVILALTGCPNNPSQQQTKSSGEQDDPLGTVKESFRKEHSLPECQATVSQLNVYLGREKQSPIAKISAPEMELLTKRLNLTEPELKELGRDEFTPLDAHYMDECFLFHDAIRALKLDWNDSSLAGHLERARLAFAWAMRQVWFFDRQSRPVPAGMALRRGLGNDMDRIHVVLAAWQQLGLDGCLLGNKSAAQGTRFWGVGVRIDSEIYLFHPRQGQPIFAADGKSILTLRQARANADSLKAALAGVEGSAELGQFVKNSGVYLAPPLSALSPRMRFLQTIVTGSPALQAGIDPTALLKRCADTGEPVEFWNPPKNLSTPTRALIFFLPAEEGGLEQAPPGQRSYDLYYATVVPWHLMPPQLEMILGAPRDRLRAQFSGRFITMMLEPNRPGEPKRARDCILRGQFDDAAALLMEMLTHISHAQQRLVAEPNLDAEAGKWIDDMRSSYAAMLRGEKNPTDSSYLNAKAQVSELQKYSEKVFLLIERSVAEPMGAQATFQLALCKHEQAERLGRSRPGNPAGQEDTLAAWKIAQDWWNNFLSLFGSSAVVPPGQLAHARDMAKQAHAEVERFTAKP